MLQRPRALPTLPKNQRHKTSTENDWAEFSTPPTAKGTAQRVSATPLAPSSEHHRQMHVGGDALKVAAETSSRPTTVRQSHGRGARTSDITGYVIAYGWHGVLRLAMDLFFLFGDVECTVLIVPPGSSEASGAKRETLLRCSDPIDAAGGPNGYPETAVVSTPAVVVVGTAAAVATGAAAELFVAVALLVVVSLTSLPANAAKTSLQLLPCQGEQGGEQGNR